MSDDFKICTCKDIGIGGVKCYCCTPAISNKKLRRRARHRLKQRDQKVIKNSPFDDPPEYHESFAP